MRNNKSSRVAVAQEGVDSFGSLVEDISDIAIWLLTPAGVVVTWNAGAEAITGYPAAEALGMPFKRLYLPKDAELAGLELQAASQRHVEAGWVFLRKDGSAGHARRTLSALGDGFRVVLRDASGAGKAPHPARRQDMWGEAVLKNSWDVISIHAADGTMLYQSPSIRRVLGYEEGELLGRDVMGYIHPDDRGHTAEKIGEVKARSGTRPPFLTRFLHKRGGWRWCECTGSNLLDDPAVGGVLFNSRDVTDRVAAEDELRRSERRFRTLVTTAPKLIWTAAPSGEVVGPATPVSFSGRSAAATAGWGWLDIIHPDDRERAEREWRQAVAAGEPLATELRVRRADGRWRLVACRVVPLRRDDGGIEEWVGVGDDVTDLRSTERWLQAVLDSAFNLFVTTDERGVIVSANAAAKRKFGYEPAELVGRHFSVLLDRPGPSDGPFAEYLAPGASTVVGLVREAVGRKRDGTTFPVEMTVNEFTAGEARHFTAVVRDLSFRRQAEYDLHLRDRAIRAVSQGILITDPRLPDNPIVFAGGGFEHLTGYRPEEAVGRNCRFLQGEKTDRAAVAVLREAIRAARPCTIEMLNYRKDGKTFWNRMSIGPVRDADGEVSHFVGVQEDVSERRLLEEQLRQAQKMEAVGRLAGGVAHDFNNLLTVINGYSEIVLSQLPPDSGLRELLAEVHRAGERAGRLTRQLLLFSRQQVLEPKVLCLNDVVADSERMLRRLIGEDVRFATASAPDLGQVRVDPGQIEQVLMNLCVNARDAMPTGGSLTVETRNVSLDEGYFHSHPSVGPGDYVMLAVSDTGIGMDEATKSRIFEPFFTTKGPGKGTGLGLAVVFGVVKQSGGHIEVYSEPGRGTAFKLYFPRVSSRPSGRSRLGEPLMPRGNETLLLVEDDGAVRAMARHVLAECGYCVLEAADGHQALTALDGHPGRLDLLISDVVMPNLGGRQLAERMRGLRPGLKVLFLSGYTDDAVVRHGVLEAEFAFLQKPFTPSGLAVKVREVLG